MRRRTCCGRVDEVLSALAAHRQPEAYVRKVMYRQQISRWRLRMPRAETTVATPRRSGTADSMRPGRQRLVDARRSGGSRRVSDDSRAALLEVLSETEVAERLGCSVGTVRSTTHRALEKWAAALNRWRGRSRSRRGATPQALTQRGRSMNADQLDRAGKVRDALHDWRWTRNGRRRSHGADRRPAQAAKPLADCGGVGVRGGGRGRSRRRRARRRPGRNRKHAAAPTALPLPSDWKPWQTALPRRTSTTVC